MTIPPYNPNIPESDDTIDKSQKDFLANFGTIFEAFNQNHVSLDDATNPGNHSIVELVEQLSSRSTLSSELSFYTKDVNGQTTQLFMRYPSNGKEFQVSPFQIFSLGAQANIPFSGFSFLPGGILVFFGFVQPNQDNFTIPLLPPVCTNIMGVNLCPLGTSTFANPLYQSNVGGLINDRGKFTGLIINNSTTVAIPPPQYYLIFGNI